MWDIPIIFFKKTLNGIQYFFWEKAKYIKSILPNENTNHGGNDDQNWEIRTTGINHTKHGKYNIDIIRKPNQKKLDNECIRIGEKTFQ